MPQVIVELPQPAELPWPPPLEEGLQEELYNTYVAPPPETPEPQVNYIQHSGKYCLITIILLHAVTHEKCLTYFCDC